LNNQSQDSRRADPRTPTVLRIFLAGGGEMGALLRSHSWAGSVLGAPERLAAQLEKRR